MTGFPALNELLSLRGFEDRGKVEILSHRARGPAYELLLEIETGNEEAALEVWLILCEGYFRLLRIWRCGS
jgi:hypothetical protein